MKLRTIEFSIDDKNFAKEILSDWMSSFGDRSEAGETGD